MSVKIVVIDYKIGNTRSIMNALKQVGASPILSNDESVISGADGVVLPGVGAFSHGMENLQKYSLVHVIRNYAESNKLLLGICLGMQILFDSSEEFGETKGLGLIEGPICQIPIQDSNNGRLPHVGWGEIQQHSVSWDGTILKNIENYSDMYFAHRYVAVPDNGENVLSVTSYSNHQFCSSVKKGRIYGCQFHPEKSSEMGLKVLKNYVDLIRQGIDG